MAVTAGSQEKLDVCKALGADILINYREDNFAERLRELTDGHGADVILDIIGAGYLAKNIVAAGLAKRCTIQLAYAIGVSKPLSLYVDTHGTGTVDDAKLEEAIKGIEKLGGLTPRGIRTHLRLNKPIYRKSAAYGHFGRKAEGDFFPWEKTDLVDDLKAAVG